MVVGCVIANTHPQIKKNALLIDQSYACNFALYIISSLILTVFPDPVCAQAIKSLPARIAGIEYFCTGVGFTYFAFSTLDLNVSYSAAS